MDNIRRAMHAHQADIEQDRLGARDYQRLAEVVSANITELKKNTQLAREAAVALHIIVLNDLSRSSELMQASPKIPMQRVGALGALQSLRLYGEYFQPAEQAANLAKAR
jgi:hypothetical protein